jgi:hypothetical protein
MRSVFDLHLRSTLLRGARTLSDDDAPRQPAPGEHSGERRLRLLRGILGESRTPKSPPPTERPQELDRT